MTTYATDPYLDAHLRWLVERAPPEEAVLWHRAIKANGSSIDLLKRDRDRLTLYLYDQVEYERRARSRPAAMPWQAPGWLAPLKRRLLKWIAIMAVGLLAGVGIHYANADEMPEHTWTRAECFDTVEYARALMEKARAAALAASGKERETALASFGRRAVIFGAIQEICFHKYY